MNKINAAVMEEMDIILSFSPNMKMHPAFCAHCCNLDRI